jgi:hypothetical protein
VLCALASRAVNVACLCAGGCPCVGGREQVLFLCDFHAHLADTEIIGFLAGTWNAATSSMCVRAAFPCRAMPIDGDAHVNVEMDPVSATQVLCLLAPCLVTTSCPLLPCTHGAFPSRSMSVCASRLVPAQAQQRISDCNLRLIGWYHSHPNFRPDPSVRDISNQCQYQDLCKDVVADKNPFIGIIVSPYDATYVRCSAWVRGCAPCATRCCAAWCRNESSISMMNFFNVEGGDGYPMQVRVDCEHYRCGRVRVLRDSADGAEDGGAARVTMEPLPPPDAGASTALGSGVRVVPDGDAVASLVDTVRPVAMAAMNVVLSSSVDAAQQSSGAAAAAAVPAPSSRAGGAGTMADASGKDSDGSGGAARLAAGVAGGSSGGGAGGDGSTAGTAVVVDPAAVPVITLVADPFPSTSHDRELDEDDVVVSRAAIRYACASSMVMRYGPRMSLLVGQVCMALTTSAAVCPALL